MASSSTSTSNSLIEGSQQYAYPSHVNAASFLSIKLSGKPNYVQWQEQMTCLLDSYDMLGFIDGTLKKPQESNGSIAKADVTAFEAKYREWKRSDTLVKGWIYGSLSEGVMEKVGHTVVGLQTANDVWNMLEKNYTSPPAPAPVIFSTPDEATRGDYIPVVLPLYRALAKGDLKCAEAILQGHEYLVKYSITEDKETPLHVAIMSQHTWKHMSQESKTKFMRYLVNMMSKTELELQNRDGNTAFCLAAISGRVDMAKIMVETNPALPMIYGTENTMPLCLAAFHGKHEMVDFLYSQSKRMKADGWTSEHRNEVLLKCIQANMFDFSRRILEDNKELPQDMHVWDVLRILAEKPEEFLETTSWAFTGVMTSPAIRLLRLVLQRVTEKLKDITIHEILRRPMIEKDQMETCPPQILFIATKMNNKQFLIELIREYPDLIWQRNDHGQSIFHVAVAHRHSDVYDLIYDIGSMKDSITLIKDKDGNNVLHLAGKIPDDISYKDEETTPYEILSEYYWYQAVERTLPPACRHVKNTDGLTPKELFIHDHRDALIKGMDQIQETINQSMMLAAIVCSVGFSIVYSIPGGFDQNSGFPIFDRSKSFISFIILGTASFLLSGTSIVTCLSIILARGVQPNETLVERWVIAQATFIASLCSIVAAFISGIFLLYPYSKMQYIILAICIAMFGININLFKSVLRHWLFDTIFRAFLIFLRVRARPMIYNQNPKVKMFWL